VNGYAVLGIAIIVTGTTVRELTPMWLAHRRAVRRQRDTARGGGQP